LIHRNKAISGFKYNEDSFHNTFRVTFDGSVGNTKKNLVLASDGILYTVADHLVAIGPLSVTQDSITLSIDNLNTNTLYRANKSIMVTGFEVYSSVNTILYSGGTISFQKGFHVDLGAQLSCKTGY